MVNVRHTGERYLWGTSHEGIQIWEPFVSEKGLIPKASYFLHLPIHRFCYRVPVIVHGLYHILILHLTVSSLMPCNLSSCFLIYIMTEFTQMIKILWLKGSSLSKWLNQLSNLRTSFIFLCLVILFYPIRCPEKKLCLQFSLKK